MIDVEKIVYLIDLKKYDNALDLIYQGISIEPESAPLYYLGAMCCLETNQVQKAKDFVSEAIRLDPVENEYKIQLATIYFENKELQSCKSLLNEINPKSEEEIEKIFELEAFLRLYQEELAEAKILAIKILNSNPANANAKSILAYSNLFKGSIINANDEIKKVLEKEPENEIARYVYLLCQIAQNRIEISEDTVLNFLREDPDNVFYRNGLLLVLLAKNPISKILLWFRFFAARNAKVIKTTYSILFRVLLVMSFFFYMNGNFFLGYAYTLLILHTIMSFPFKTIPMIQNLFVLPFSFGRILIPKWEVIASFSSLLLTILGFTLIGRYAHDIRYIISGLLAVYISGLFFDYFYVIHKNYNKSFILIFFFAIFILIGLLIANNKWVDLLYLGIIILMNFYVFWKMDSSNKAA